MSWVDFWSFERSCGGSCGGLGASCAPLRASWEAPGDSGGRLGSVLGGLMVVLDLLGDFRASKPLRMPSFGGVKGAQDEVKKRGKTDQNRCQKLRRKRTLLKIVLEPSWGDLGSF